MTTIERSPEATNRELAQKFADLAIRVFGKDIAYKRVFAVGEGLDSPGCFNGWNLYDRTKNRPKNPILRGLQGLFDLEIDLSGSGRLFSFEHVHSKQMIGKIEAVDHGNMDNSRVWRYRPSRVRLDDPAFLGSVQRFVDEYKSAFGQELGIVANY